MVIIVYKYLKYYWVTKVYKAISPNLVLIFGFLCIFDNFLSYGLQLLC